MAASDDKSQGSGNKVTSIANRKAGAKQASTEDESGAGKPAKKRASKKTVSDARKNAAVTAGSGRKKSGDDGKKERLRVPDSIPPLSPEERAKVPGARLLEMLFDEANRNNMGMEQLADAIGTSRPNLYSLRQKRRSVPNMNREYKEACARFLGIPYVSVLIAAEVIKPEDFLVPLDDDDRAIDAALDFIRRDPVHGDKVPVEIADADKALKLFVIECYEKAEGKRLLTNRVQISAELSDQVAFHAERERTREQLIKSGTHAYSPDGSFDEIGSSAAAEA